MLRQESITAVSQPLTAPDWCQACKTAIRLGFPVPHATRLSARACLTRHRHKLSPRVASLYPLFSCRFLAASIFAILQTALGLAGFGAFLTQKERDSESKFDDIQDSAFEPIRTLVIHWADYDNSTCCEINPTKARGLRIHQARLRPVRHI